MKTNVFYKATILSKSFAVGDMLSLYYEIGQTTKPRMGKIFVFDTYENLKTFTGNSSCLVVYKGIGTNPHKIQSVVCGIKGISTIYIGLQAIEDFWKCKRQKKKTKVGTHNAPIGTIVVDSFTPTEIVN